MRFPLGGGVTLGYISPLFSGITGFVMAMNTLTIVPFRRSIIYINTYIYIFYIKSNLFIARMVENKRFLQRHSKVAIQCSHVPEPWFRVLKGKKESRTK